MTDPERGDSSVTIGKVPRGILSRVLCVMDIVLQPQSASPTSPAEWCKKVNTGSLPLIRTRLAILSCPSLLSVDVRQVATLALCGFARRKGSSDVLIRGDQAVHFPVFPARLDYPEAAKPTREIRGRIHIVLSRHNESVGIKRYRSICVKISPSYNKHRPATGGTRVYSMSKGTPAFRGARTKQ